MKTAIKTVATVLMLCMLFVVTVVAEACVRGFARKSIPVIVQDDVPVAIEADVMPDFLWMGQAWRVSVECAAPVLVDMNADWTAFLPPGKHRIYCNHDCDNTSDYGSRAGFGQPPPSVITVRAAND